MDQIAAPSSASESADQYARYDLPAAGFRNYWYPVMKSWHVRRKPVAVKLLGDDIVLFRDGGALHALSDRYLDADLAPVQQRADGRPDSCPGGRAGGVERDAWGASGAGGAVCGAFPVAGGGVSVGGGFTRAAGGAMALRLDTLVAVDFRPGGTHALHACDGWSHPGWTEGTRAGIDLGAVAACHEYFLCIDAAPYLGQTFSVFANGQWIGSHFDPRPFKVAFPLTQETVARRRELLVEIEVHDPKRPCDHGPSDDKHWRGLHVERISVVGAEACAAECWSASRGPPEGRLDDAALLERFESLGDNCEFGFVQKRNGVPGSSLLRFCATPILQLLRGLEDGFEGLRDGEGVTLVSEEPGGAEDYQIWAERYGLHYHTLVMPGGPGPAAVLAAEREKLRHKRSKLLADLVGGGRIFVVKQNYELQPGEVWAVWLALQRYGANTLLWVRADPSGVAHPNVEIVRPGLLRGTIGQFAPYTAATDGHDSDWCCLCRVASSLQRDFRGFEGARDV